MATARRRRWWHERVIILAGSMPLLRLLYQVGLGALLVLAGPLLLLRKGHHYLTSLPGRLGRGLPADAPQGALWLHAVSVGEVGVAATVARALPPELPLLVTTITPTGQAQAQKSFAGRAVVTYLPFDLGWLLRRFLARLEPRALVLVEGDHWPLLLSLLRRRGRPVVVINGRVSDRGFARLRWLARTLPRLLGAFYTPVTRFGVQTAADRERLLALGVLPERVAVTGNLKFEAPEPARKPELERLLAQLAGGRPVLVAGSTMPGEEEAVLAAFQLAGAGARALLVLAPRHPERFDEVARLIARSGLALVRRRELLAGGPAAEPSPAVLLLDTLGELAGLYRGALAAFIGGTLVPRGGHNPLEPARFGVAVVAGPAMENFRDMAERFDQAAAWQRVASSTELGRLWQAWLDDPAAARAVGARAVAFVEQNRGALERTRELLAPLVAGCGVTADG